MLALKSAFASTGKNFIFDPYSTFTYHNIIIGDDVFIGEQAHLSATKSQITIGDKVMIGPRVMIITGDHNSSVIGSYMKDVTDKEEENDKPIRIHNDVWIGAGAIILKGVKIGEGSIIAAGSLVNDDVLPNTIVAGVPARKIRDRFAPTELSEHKKMLSQL